MKLNLQRDEVFEVVGVLAKHRTRREILSALSSARSTSRKYSKNAEQLRQRHRAKAERIGNIINKIVEQIEE